MKVKNISNCAVKSVVPLTEAGRKLLDSECINPKCLPVNVCSVDVLCLNKLCHGIGVSNRFWGMAFFSHDEAIKGLVNIEPVEVLRFSFPKRVKYTSCCVFADLLDYFSYLTLVKEPEGSNLPKICDCFVMNHVCNYLAVMYDTTNYAHIHLMFPRTFIGKTMEKTFVSRCPSRVVVHSDFYKGFDSLHDYLKSIKTTN